MSFDLIGALVIGAICLASLAVYYGSGAHRTK